MPTSVAAVTCHEVSPELSQPGAGTSPSRSMSTIPPRENEASRRRRTVSVTAGPDAHQLQAILTRADTNFMVWMPRSRGAVLRVTCTATAVRATSVYKRSPLARLLINGGVLPDAHLAAGKR